VLQPPIREDKHSAWWPPAAAAVAPTPPFSNAPSEGEGTMTTKERKYVTLEKRPDGIALLWLDNPRDKINKLEFALGEDLRDAVEAVLADAEIKAAVVISRKTDNWIVGADIMQLYGFSHEDETLAYIERGQRLFDTIAAAPKPFVAAFTARRWAAAWKRPWLVITASSPIIPRPRWPCRK
jgi:hypothetical protein